MQGDNRKMKRERTVRLTSLHFSQGGSGAAQPSFSWGAWLLFNELFFDMYEVGNVKCMSRGKSFMLRHLLKNIVTGSSTFVIVKYLLF